MDLCPFRLQPRAMSRVPRPPASPNRRRGARRPGAFRPERRPLHQRLDDEALCFLCQEADRWGPPQAPGKTRGAPWAAQGAPNQAVKATRKSSSDGLYTLMLALSKVCKHRNASGCDLWTWLLEPLRNLVPCEEVKFVVKCLGPVPQKATPQLPFSHDAEVRQLLGHLDFGVRTLDKG